MQRVELWEVLAVSPEFLEAIQGMPEAIFAESIVIGGKEITGSKLIVTGSCQDEIGVKLPGLLDHALTTERSELVLIRRSGTCRQCRPTSTPDIATSNCPHIAARRIQTINKVWKIDVERLRAAFASIPPPPPSAP